MCIQAGERVELPSGDPPRRAAFGVSRQSEELGALQLGGLDGAAPGPGPPPRPSPRHWHGPDEQRGFRRQVLAAGEPHSENCKPELSPVQNLNLGFEVCLNSSSRDLVSGALLFSRQVRYYPQG